MASIRATYGPPDFTPEPLCLDFVPALSEVPDVAGRARRAWGVGPLDRLDLDRVCESLDIEVSVLSLGVPDGGAQGFLVPRAGGRRFRIEVDPEPAGGWGSVAPDLRKALARHRKRFLVGHELAHTLFFAEGPAGPKRVVFDSPRQERFCDETARALLVPRAAAAAIPFAPEGVVALQRRFDVSVEVALRSAVAAHGDGGVAWLLLQRDEQTLVQWTSAERSLTTRALRALRRLAGRAFREEQAEADLVAPNQPARALYLPRREQVIVTCGCSPA